MCKILQIKLTCVYLASLIDSVHSWKRWKNKKWKKIIKNSSHNEKYMNLGHTAESWQSLEKRVGQVPILLKQCLKHPTPKIAALSMAQLQLSSMTLCRHTNLTKTPAISVFGLISRFFFFHWVQAPSSYLLMLLEDLAAENKQPQY